jgi:enoyl-[acyl-carrier protein] reductase I
MNFNGKTYLVMGVANKKSVAFAVAQMLETQGARVIYSVRSPQRAEFIQSLPLLPSGEKRLAWICDVEKPADIEALGQAAAASGVRLDGCLHSIAFANYSHGMQPFSETRREDFLQAVSISAFSLVEIARTLKPYFNPKASVVTISISSTEVTAENYGYMSPIKAALEGCVRFLAKDFSRHSEVRFNAVKAGPLKTSASAGIPGYIENYLYAEQLTFRKRALQTQEVAQAALFLLSDLSSGINGQGITVDAGLGMNFFDQSVVQAASKK